MQRRSTIQFLSPLRPLRTVIGTVPGHPSGNWGFDVLSDSGRLQMEYDGKPQAKEARDMLASAENVYRVGNWPLFQAIEKTMAKEA